MPADREHEIQPLLDQESALTVYDIIHQIRQDVITYIDTPLTYADLTGPELTYAFVKPLQEKYAKLENKAIIFCFLVNRVHFIRDPNFTTATLNRSRGLLCELLAMRVIRQWSNLIELAHVLITSWPVFEGCSDEILSKGRELQDNFDPREKVGNAMEMAILSDAKLFVKSAPCQKVIDAIWSGKIVYTAQSSYSLIRDHYKQAPIHYYDPHHAPMLDHYRLKVPAIRSILEYGNFLILFVLFVVTLEYYDPERINLAESIFMVYASGFCLEKLAAMQEHGLRVYIHGTWNGFDVAFKRWARLAGMDCLALAACLLFPRLAFVTLSNNLMVLAFRAMFWEFAILMAIAVFCFAGFLYSLWTLSRGTFDYSSSEITWWLLDLYFGLDATGFSRASTFHPIFGPALMVTFACLSNTLLLTVLVSILSHTFSTISSDAEAEAKFRRAVATIEGVKADALFSYLPPMNLLAFAVMFPASYILSPRWFHKVNTFLIIYRVCAAPVLIGVAFYERHTIHLPGITIYERVSHVAERVFDSLPRRLKRMTFFEGLAGNGADIDTVFMIEEEINHDSLDAIDIDEDEATQPQQRPSITSDSLTTPSRQRRKSNTSHVGPASSGQAITFRSNASDASVDQSRHAKRRSGIFGTIDATTPGPQPSPLAQLYQPIVPTEEDTTDEGMSLPPGAGLPPRRRLASMTRPRRPSIEPFQHAPSISPPVHSHPARPFGPPPAEHMLLPIPPSTLPEQAEEELRSPPVVRSPGELSEINRRIIEMERRQERIENLLISLVSEVKRK
ncbi:related to receptor-activated Ca2+-permeable cation channel-Laccaria bicolor [Serendipita indica DSM 11827]|uniref:Related to receptor-activated Ca2+-permeable cation channel-Laccaria bicolor n=1 Tax=Serendipita indica (strain DSM 11827) TaxID=1109443 RepID=G4THF9_SERID|nr:related to receptor-activated Ca2+-permeable cation channel-Laccaria bicolor [Serendipita indica DSM 11827]